jgi:hypothetical protein
MNVAEQEALRSQVTLLERRLQRTERRVQIHKIGWVLLLVLVLLLFGINRVDVVQAQPPQSKLRLRELDIVDEKGRERIVIAAPLPDAVIDGKVAHRVRPVSAAVQFKAPDGTSKAALHSQMTAR